MESKHTAGAQRAIGLASLVNKVFSSERVASSLAGHAGYRIEMAGPEAFSTSERKGALDQLRLAPVDPARVGAAEGSGAAILIGTADPNLSQVELRTHERLAQLHAERFNGAELPIDPAEYDAMIGKIEAFFERQGITTVTSAKREDASLAPRADARRSPVRALVIVGAIILLALLAFALRMR